MTINEKAMNDLLYLMEKLLAGLEETNDPGPHFDAVREIADIGVTIARLAETNKPGMAGTVPGSEIK